MPLFEGFTEETVSGAGADVFLRMGGDPANPALVMLHGYPQTSAMWHLVAPRLVDRFHVICPDLRGYGRSGKPGTGHPGSDPTHALYSKRAMADDILAALDGLGVERFFLAGHDRGGRVAHRLAMDRPERVSALSVLDIAPTREMYAGTDRSFATAYFHWFFLIQPYPLPERLIDNGQAFWEMKCRNLGAGTFHPEAEEEYRRYFCTPEGVHASCEDYRAAASIDLVHDEADGDRKLAMPVQALWAKDRVVDRHFEVLAEWRKRAEIVEGFAVEGSHYVAEEDPETIANLYREFFARTAR